MTIEACENALRQALLDKSNKVIALSGRWGTGKSYLVTNVLDELAQKDNSFRKHIYVSLFGVASLHAMRAKLAEGLAARDAETLKHVASAGASVLRKLPWIGAAFDDVVALGLHQALKGRFIVIDDMERKNAKFEIQEILGFIDEYSMRQGCHFLLVLNTEALAQDQQVWREIQEKVVDVSLVLNTDPKAACSIAMGKSTFALVPEITQAIEACEVNNIRVIQKVHKVVHTLLAAHATELKGDPRAIVSRVVLLTAIAYRARPDLPSYTFVAEYTQTKERDTDPDAKWNTLMRRLQIQEVGRLEALVIDYLESGQDSKDLLATEIASFLADHHARQSEVLLSQFLRDAQWAVNETDQSLVAQAAVLKDYVVHYRPEQLLGLTQTLEKLDTGAALARELTAAWIASLQRRPAQAPGAGMRGGEKLGDQFPKEIEVAWSAWIQSTKPRIGLLEAARRMDQDLATASDLEAFRLASMDEIVETLSRFQGDDFAALLRVGLVSDYKSVSFARACIAVMDRAPQSRRSASIQEKLNLFEVQHQEFNQREISLGLKPTLLRELPPADDITAPAPRPPTP